MLRQLYRGVLYTVGGICSQICFLFIILSVLRLNKLIETNNFPYSSTSKYITGKNLMANAAEYHLAKHWTKHKYQLVKENDVPLWGSYRPDIYFGMKTSTSPHSLCTGIFWNSDVKRRFRHRTAEKELTRLHWIRHNGRSYGEELLEDKDNNLVMKASFYASNDIDSKKEAGDATWIQQISANSVDNNIRQSKNVFYYLGMECSNRSQDVKCIEGKLSIKNMYEHIHDNQKILTIGGSSITGSFMLQLIISLDSKKYCRSNECSIADGSVEPITTSIYGSNRNKDVHFEIDYMERELEMIQYGQVNNLQAFDVKAELSNLFPTGSAFAVVKIRSLENFVIDSAYYDIKYKGKLEFENLARKLCESYERNLQLYVSARQQFDDTFSEKFKLNDKKFETHSSFTPDEIEMAKVALSSVLGGIGYFHGHPEIKDAHESVNAEDASSSESSSTKSDNITQCEAVTLFTATPSRTVFPRGFMWDEGFHQLLISLWDPQLSVVILKHWLSAMYFYDGPRTSAHDFQGGWIPREMILGDIGRARVPSEFIPQRVNIANPPTFMLVMENLIKICEDLNTQNEISSILLNSLKSSLIEIYPAVDSWLTWYIDVQGSTSTKLPNTFRWRRSSADKKIIPNTLASGLDDYPRALVATDDEAHVDLLSWMICACNIMVKYGSFIDGLGKSGVLKYNRMRQKFELSLSKYHWIDPSISTNVSSATYVRQVSTENGTNVLGQLPSGFYDIGLDNHMSRFEWFVLYRCGNEQERKVVEVQVPLYYIQNKLKFCPDSHPTPLNYRQEENGQVSVRQMLTVAPIEDMVLKYIPRIGYVNIFPFILMVLPVSNHSQISATLDMIEDPGMLWTDHGLRSIAKSDIFYEQRNSPNDAPYWRGPIWININYLALRSLHYYKSIPGLHQQRCIDIYNRLRRNILRSVLGSYKSTGFLWEQYNDKSGEGMRGHPFSGWTVLVTNIMAESY